MPSPTQHQLNIEDQIGEVKSATAPAQEVSLKNARGAKVFTKIEPTATS